MKKIVSVLGPGDVLPDSEYYQLAEEVGRLLVQKGFAVMNGGYDGVMEAASKGASEAGGGVLAVTAEVYYARGKNMNQYITKEIRVKSAVDRLMELIDLSDASIIVGNSPGTFVEVLTTWDFTKKKFIRKRPLIVMGAVWQALLGVFEKEKQFSDHREMLQIAETPQQAITMLEEQFGIQPLLPDLNVLSL